jgi:hypothetical protein
MLCNRIPHGRIRNLPSPSGPCVETSLSRELMRTEPDPRLSHCPRRVDGLNAKGNMSQYWARAVHGLAGLDGSSRAKKPAWEWNGGL